MTPEDFKALYELEEGYWWFVGMRKITATLLHVLLAPRPRRILDAGCGTGFMLRWLRQYSGGQSVVGIDISPEGLAYCRKRGEEILAQCSVAQLPFPDGFFDLVTSFDVLVQLTPELAKTAFAELTRVLRRNGLLFIRVAAFQWLYSEHDQALSTQHRYTATELKDLWLRQGLETERVTYANTLLFPVAVALRMFRGRNNRRPRSDVRPLPKYLRWLNPFLTQVLAAESVWLKRVRWRLPFGLSVIAVARKR